MDEDVARPDRGEDVGGLVVVDQAPTGAGVTGSTAGS